MALLGAAPGCSDTQINDVVLKVFEPRKTPQQNMVAAFASEDPDVRRDALGQVAKSKQCGEDWAVKGYLAIALLDNDPQARCVAVRALELSGDPRAVEACLKLLNHREYPAEEVRPPDDLTRWDATLALAKLSARGLVPEDQAEYARTTFADRLKLDTMWQVRAAAASGLGNYSTAESLGGLISGLNDENFAVVHACEESLVRLTGVTHNCDALAWEAWLEAHTGDPFAEAGNIPESRRPPYRNRFEKAGYDFNEFVRWLVPGRKE